MMLGAVLGYTFAIRLGWPMPLAVAMSLALCALFGLRGRAHAGAALRRARLERLADGDGCGRHRARQHRAVHLRQGAARLSVHSSRRSRSSCSAPACFRCSSSSRWSGIGITVALQLAFHRTRLGKALLAVVQNKDAARLMGINVRVAIAFSFALSTALAGLAGLLIAPLFSVHSDMGTLFGIKAFAVAILGGITLGVRRDARGPALRTDRGAGHRASLARPTRRSSLSRSSSWRSPLMPNGLLGRAATKKV